MLHLMFWSLSIGLPSKLGSEMPRLMHFVPRVKTRKRAKKTIVAVFNNISDNLNLLAYQGNFPQVQNQYFTRETWTPENCGE